MQPFCSHTEFPIHWTSYYDTAPGKELLVKYVNFAALKTSLVRLLLSAVNVTTAEFEVFDSYVDALSISWRAAACRWVFPGRSLTARPTGTVALSATHHLIFSSITTVRTGSAFIPSICFLGHKSAFDQHDGAEATRHGSAHSSRQLVLHRIHVQPALCQCGSE